MYKHNVPRFFVDTEQFLIENNFGLTVITYPWYMNECKYIISHLNGIVSFYHPTKHSEKLCIEFLNSI